MKIKSIMSVLLVSVFLQACNYSVITNEAKLNIMAYYVPERDFYAEQIPVEKLTHIIFSFSHIIDGKMDFSNIDNHAKLDKLVAQKDRNPDLKVMIACGGWGAGGFSDMASNPENRRIFIDSAIDFISRHNLDGIDIDWEYPGMRGAGNKFRTEDKENFTFLMKELREALDGTGKNMTLTFASAGWERYYEYIETIKVMEYVDYINIMTYDLAGGGSQFTAHHTNLGAIELENLKGTPWYDNIMDMAENLEDGEDTYTPRGADAITRFVINLGVDPKKIVIGAAFYGRAWKGVPGENNGLYQPNRGVHTGWMAYTNIRNEYEGKNGFVRHWDDVALAPFLYNPGDSIFISYDDTISVFLKTEYCIENKLGGIMFWQLGNDTKTDNSLLDAIYRAAVK